MHKILVLGHPSSNYQDVASLLHSYGMSVAKASRRDGFSPEEITEIICQAHGVGENSISEFEPNFNQIEVGNIWHGMALDLMLGNLDSKIWGWAETKSIYLLNYWRDLDPEITFVLVYSNPEDVLLNNGRGENLSASDLESNIQQWIAYNESLLYFYNRNKDRCFLVHSQQVGESSNRYLLEIGTKINAPWLKQLSHNSPENNAQIENKNFIQAPSDDEVNNLMQPEHRNTAVTELVHELNTQESDMQERPLSLFLSKLIIQQHPKLTQLYEDLQSFANFPLNESASGFNKQSFNQSAFDAWLEMSSYLNQLKQTEAKVLAITQKNHELMTEVIKLDEIPKLAQEKDQLVTQLHQVQEQLEQIYLDNKNLKTNETANQAKLKELEAAQSKLKTMQTELKKLDALPELEQENSTLLLQLHHVQEELERYYLENQAYKAQVNSKPKVLEYSAEQIKNQLAYRLGGLMIKNSKTVLGFVFMPITLMRESRRYKQEKLKMPKYEKKTLSEYEKNQLAIVKRHLSYRLGTTLLSNIHNPLNWLALPYRLWREISLYKKTRN